MIGQENSGGKIYPPIKYADTERPPTPQEIALWEKATLAAKRVNLLSYAMKAQYRNIRLTHEFAVEHKITLEEPELPDLEQRMLLSLAEIERLKDLMCDVNQLELGIRISSGGGDLDIVQPEDVTTMGWVLPAVIGAVIVIGIIARWAYLEKEVDEVTTAYNGVLKRSDMALCEDPTSQTCKSWQTAKKTGGYFQRETIIDSVKNAAKNVGSAVATGAKKGLAAALPLAIPLLLWLYMPRRRREG